MSQVPAIELKRYQRRGDISGARSNEADDVPLEVYERDADMNRQPDAANLERLNPLVISHVSEFSSGLATSWWIKGILPQNSFSVAYGPPGSGKSFFVLDMAASIARGKSWRERIVRQTNVVYVAAEGVAGFRNRVLAYAEHEKIHLSDLPVYVCESRLDLREDWLQLAERINAIGNVGLVIVDTLAAVTPGMDENSSGDMGRAADACQKIREATGASVLLVHHTNKQGEMRGWSGLEGNVDTKIGISRNGDSRKASIDKQKDGLDGEAFDFQLKPVELGTDEDGDPVTSCVVQFDENAPMPDRSSRLTAGSKIGLDALREVIGAKGKPMGGSSSIPRGVRAVEEDDWRRQFYLRYGSEDDAPATKSKAFRRAKQDLIARNLVMMSAPFVWVVGK